MRFARCVLVAASLALGCGNSEGSRATGVGGDGFGSTLGGAAVGGNTGNDSGASGVGAAAQGGVGAAAGSEGAGTSGGAGMSGGAGRAGAGGAGSAGAGGAGSAGAGGAGSAGTPGASCSGGFSVCGPEGLADCCASSVVPGGTFYGSSAPDYAATISDFRLDIYEVTVGRFRRFLAEYPGSLPHVGSGKNPNNPADAGWDPAWDASFEMDLPTLRTRLKCPFESTWTDEPGAAEALPINCITWYEAMAFCIWDGGRLATEAEWNYAAAGGSEQRVFPWSSPPDSAAIDESFAVYDGAPIAAVGSKSKKGDGKWGHADLAGNVFEWVQDNIANYPAACVDCAFLDPATTRGDRGGAWSSPVMQLWTRYRGNVMPSGRQVNVGARCARSL